MESPVQRAVNPCCNTLQHITARFQRVTLIPDSSVRHGCDTGSPHVLVVFRLVGRKSCHRYSASLFRTGTLVQRIGVRPHPVVTPNEVPIFMPLRHATSRHRAPSAFYAAPVATLSRRTVTVVAPFPAAFIATPIG